MMRNQAQIADGDVITPIEDTTPGDDAGEPDEDPADPDACVGDTVIDDVCIINPIQCLLGHDYIDGHCAFTGCPIGYLLIDGQCQELVIVAPCDKGFTRMGDVYVPILVDGPDVVVPVCPAGQHREDRACVPDFTIKPNLFGPGPELATDG
jgi:hypothetical protein